MILHGGGGGGGQIRLPVCGVVERIQGALVVFVGG